jgi:hypothetical protein
MLEMLDEGFGFVGLFRLGFFAANCEIFNQIGLFDEGYQDGGYEDNDFYLRLKEADIGCYISEEIEYLQNLASLWPQEKSRVYFYSKWKFAPVTKKVHRALSGTDITSTMPRELRMKKWNESSLCIIPLVTYKNDFSKILLKYKIHDSRAGFTSLDKIEISLNHLASKLGKQFLVFKIIKGFIVNKLKTFNK